MAENSYSNLTCDLPGDMMLEILTRQPYNSLLKFKCVSKPWYSFISSPFFIKMHSEYWSKDVEYDSFAVLGHNKESHNVGIIFPLGGSSTWKPIGICEQTRLITVGVSKGLICLSPINDSKYCESVVVNPAIRKSKRTYRKRLYQGKPEKNASVSIGFGYDEKRDEFKIVRVEQLKEDSGVVRRSIINIYSLYTDSWKEIKCSGNIGSLIHKDEAQHSGNFLYWKTKNNEGITVFSLSCENFYSIPLPGPVHSRCLQIKGCNHGTIEATIGNLKDRSSSSCAWIWIMSLRENHENNFIFSWRKDKVYSKEQLQKELDLVHAIRDKYSDYKHLTQICYYMESLMPVRRLDHFFLNVIQRLKNTSWARFIDEDVEDPN